jgi:helix-turn-helix protein
MAFCRSRRHASDAIYCSYVIHSLPRAGGHGLSTAPPPLPRPAAPRQAMPYLALPGPALPDHDSPQPRHGFPISHTTYVLSRVNHTLNTISPEQCRAGRSLLNITREELGEVSGIPSRTLADFEGGLTAPRAGTLDKLSRAFADAGVVFVAVPDSPGGVIMLKPRKEG